MNSLISINYDLDLFKDFGGFFLHFATAGGYIPENIISNPIHNQIRSFLLNQNSLNFEYKVNPFLDEILSLKFEAQNINKEDFNREAYLHDFISYAKKGCFSFDRTFISNHFDRKFHLVAYPIFTEGQIPFFWSNNHIEDIVRSQLNRPRTIFY